MKTVSEHFKNLLDLELTDELIATIAEDETDLKKITDKIYTKYIESFTSPIKFYSGEPVKIDNSIDLSTKKILVLSLIRKAEDHIEYIKKLIDDLNIATDNKTYLYYFTNNQSKETKQILQNWSENNSNINGYTGQDEALYIARDNEDFGNRIHKLAEYRNICWSKAIDQYGKDFDYVIVLDSDLISNIPIVPVLDSLMMCGDWSSISGNMSFTNSLYHYDALALRMPNDPINIQELYPKFKYFYGINNRWLDKLYIFNNIVKVDSAFGGLTIYKFNELYDIYKNYNKLYDTENYTSGTCEHITLSEKLQHNKYINANISYPTNSMVENSIIESPLVFVPRDAGFFSVFNFLLGMISKGNRIYPFFNKKAFMKIHNNKNSHFGYWTDSENCWLDYFEPVKFFTDDTTQTNRLFGNFKITQGEKTPKTFAHPPTVEYMMSHKNEFNVWRKYIHNFYKQYIKFIPDIYNAANKFLTNNFNTTNIIGIHYRHPIHSCESGKIYFKDYFEKIDEILSRHPDAELFLATDNELAILVFKNKYKDKVKYISSISRLSVDNILESIYALMNKTNIDPVGVIDGKGYELHQVILANEPNAKNSTIDLLTEVQCMTNCKWLIHGISNIPLAISYMNPDLDLILIKDKNK